jgi:hypothetical protein
VFFRRLIVIADAPSFAVFAKGGAVRTEPQSRFFPLLKKLNTEIMPSSRKNRRRDAGATIRGGFKLQKDKAAADADGHGFRAAAGSEFS